jgi:integrase/recombinase XerD
LCWWRICRPRVHAAHVAGQPWAWPRIDLRLMAATARAKRMPVILRPEVISYLQYLGDTKGLSQNTIAAYGNDLNQFARYLEDCGADSWDVDRATVSGFLTFLIEREYEPSSQARKLAAVKSMYKYLRSEGKSHADPTQGLGSARVTKKRPTVISVAEMDRLLSAAAATRTPEGYRDSAMLELLYATGMRVSELVALDVDDTEFERGVVICGRGGSRQRTLPFGARAGHALLGYIRGARRKLFKYPDEAALFLNHRGKRLTRQGSWLIIKGHAATAALSTPITPHTLRHSFATHRLRGDTSIPEVQSLLGHASPATTQIYLELAREKGSVDPALPGNAGPRPK